MRKITKFICLALCATTLTACNNQQAGSVIGAITGGLIGSTIGGGEGKVLAVGVGALAGAFIGGQIGRQLDTRDRSLMQNTSVRALETAPTGKSMAWYNSDSGARGTVVPTRNFKSSYGEYCREYTQTVTIGGKLHRAYGRACRKPDGSWQIMN